MKKLLSVVALVTALTFASANTAQAIPPETMYLFSYTQNGVLINVYAVMEGSTFIGYTATGPGGKPASYFGESSWAAQGTPW